MAITYTYTATNLQSQSPWIAGETVTVASQYTFSGTDNLANNETIGFVGIIPPGGVKILDIKVKHVGLDSNASPALTYKVGDVADTDRFIVAAYAGRGTTSGNSSITNSINVNYVESTNGVYPGVATGPGVIYQTTENTNSTGTADVASQITNGYTDMILTCTASPTNSVTDKTITLYVTYACIGNAGV